MVTNLIQVMIRDNEVVTVGLNETEFLVLEEAAGASVTTCAVLTGRLERNVIVRMHTLSSSTDGK